MASRRRTGKIVPLIERNSRIPACASRVFITVVDGQSIVEVHVLQGESDLVAYDRSLARLELTHLPPAPRGVPRIEVAVEAGRGNVVSVALAHAEPVRWPERLAPACA